MFNKSNVLLLFLLIIVLGTVSAVGAADVNNDTVSDSIGDVIGADNMDEIGLSEEISTPVSDSDSDALRDTTWSTYTRLQEIIDGVPEEGTLTLSTNFYCDDDFNDYGIRIEKSMIIDGNGHTLDSCEKTGVILIFADNVIIRNLNLINGYDSVGGSGAYIRGNNVMFENCNFINNTAEHRGGAINTNGFTIVENCYFYNNYAEEEGGAIYAYYPSQNRISIYIGNSIFRSNRAGDYGGAVYLDTYTSDDYFITGSAQSLINNTIFYNNEAEYGGAVFNFQSTVVLDSIFDTNHAEQGGGAVYMNNGAVIDNNDGLFAQTFSLDIRGTTSFINNDAGRYGGAIKIYANPTPLQYGIKGKLNVSGNVLFEGNSAKTGGALSIIDSDSNVENAVFRKNSADSGSAMEGGLAKYCIFEGNNDPVTVGTEVIDNVKANLALKTAGSYYNDKTLTVTVTNARTAAALSNVEVLVVFSNGNKALLKTNSNGVATYAIPFNPGTYSATASVLTDNIEASSVKLANINIAKTPLTVTPTKLSTTYASGKYFQIKVTNTQTKNAVSGVKLKLQVYTKSKAKTVTVTTDANGIAKYDGSKLALGTHKVIVNIADTTYFTGAKKTSSIAVSKATYKVSAPSVTNAYKQAGSFQVTVKNKASGKAVSGVKVTIKVTTGKNTKTYSVKTNSKGIASISTKSLAKTTHKVAISIKANTYYKAASAKSSIKISKSKIATSLADEGTPISDAASFATENFVHMFYDDGSLRGYAAKLTLRDANGKQLVGKTIKVYFGDRLVATGPSGEFFFIPKQYLGTFKFVFEGDGTYKASSCQKYISILLA